jgi:hypothetical protein
MKFLYGFFRFLVAGTAGSAAGLLAVTSITGPAQATVAAPQLAGPTPSCQAKVCTITYDRPGVGQAFVVPPGVTRLTVALYGGVGGSASYSGLDYPLVTNESGDGAKVFAALAVSPGEVLGVDVGGAGAPGSPTGAAGGANGGGSSSAVPINGINSFSGFPSGGGGGGATDLTTAPAGDTVLLDAAGGGGAGLPGAELVQGAEGACLTLGTAETGAGGNADGSGGTGSANTGRGDESGGSGGSAGTTSAAGTGGSGGENSFEVNVECNSFFANGEGGASGSGSSGGPASASGGGGGGGFFGGGAGGSGADGFTCARGGTPPEPCGGQQAASGGGGGGASYIAGAGVSDAILSDTGNSGQVNQGDGEAELEWADPIGTGSPRYPSTADQVLTVPATTGLLSADAAAGPAGDRLTASGPAGGHTASGGSVNVSSDGSFRYTPLADFAGQDSFSYTVSDSAGDSSTGTVTVQVQFLAQDITFTSAPPSPAVLGGSYTPAATRGGSGQPVVFSIAPASSSACSLSGGIVSFIAVGTCTVHANQAGQGAYAAAAQASQSVLVQPRSQKITFTSRPPTPTLVGDRYVPAAAGGGSGQPVVFSIAPASKLTCSLRAGKVTFIRPGTCTVDASQAGLAGQYAAAPQVSQVIAVDQAPKFVLHTPRLSAAGRHSYGYAFTAGGLPAPTYALAAGAPSWLKISRTLGTVSGTVPASTKSFRYSVTATSSTGHVTAGPFTVKIGKAATATDVGVRLSCPAIRTVGTASRCTVTVANHGTVAATGISAAVSLPSVLTRVSCGSGCTAQGNDVSWKLTRLAAGASKKFSLTVTAVAVGRGHVSAVADTGSYDSSLTDNTDAVSATVSP